MKKLFALALLILMIAPLSTMADTNEPGDDKLIIKNEINDEIRPRSLFEPVVILKNTYELKFAINVDASYKFEVTDANGMVVSSKSVTDFGGQGFNIDISAWSSGYYKILITNQVNGTKSYAEFSL